MTAYDYYGSPQETDDDNDTTITAYNNERGTIECASSVTSNTQTKNCNIWNGNQVSWDGLVGLMYPSDLGYSANNSSWAETLYFWGDSTSWMNSMLGRGWNIREWLLSPSSETSNGTMTWDGGVFGYYVTDISTWVRPALNLKSGAKVSDATGTLEDPYVVVIE